MKKRTYKKIKSFIIFLVISILIYLILAKYTYYEDEYILKGYYEEKNVIDTGFGIDFMTYHKYYYSQEIKHKFEESILYRKVEEKDINYISEYFDDIKKWFETLELDNKFDFKNEIITTNDYFAIVSKEGETLGDYIYGRFEVYRVYLYDYESNILYRIHTKT